MALKLRIRGVIALIGFIELRHAVRLHESDFSCLKTQNDRQNRGVVYFCKALHFSLFCCVYEIVQLLALRADLSALATLSQPVCPTKAFMWNREQCQAAITKVLEWDFDTVYATHGTCPIKHAKDAIRDEFQFLWD